MRRNCYRTLLVFLAVFFLWRLPAYAEVSETITETSSTVAAEEIAIDTAATLETSQTAELGHSAASSGTVSGTSNNNQLIERNEIEKSADIWADSLSGSSGIITVNQAPGSLNSQGTAVSISLVDEAADTLLEATSALQDHSSGNIVSADRSKTVNNIHGNAFFGVAGIIAVNQSAGSINTQSTLISLTVGARSAVSLSDTDLGMLNTSNRVDDIGVSRTDSISTFALQGVRGIVSINQSSGCLNHQVSAISVSLREFTLY